MDIILHEFLHNPPLMRISFHERNRSTRKEQEQDKLNIHTMAFLCPLQITLLYAKQRKLLAWP